MPANDSVLAAKVATVIEVPRTRARPQRDGGSRSRRLGRGCHRRRRLHGQRQAERRPQRRGPGIARRGRVDAGPQRRKGLAVGLRRGRVVDEHGVLAVAGVAQPCAQSGFQWVVPALFGRFQRVSSTDGSGQEGCQ